jgi:8-oxo-dGTP pyrophosphatase MutT (NUDIX family)
MSALTHAGGVVFRPVGDGHHVLLVRSSRSPRWVLPKGHIDAGETPEETAVREVREEAGVDASIHGEVGESAFVTPRGEAVRVRWFLMLEQGAWPEWEHRELLWCDPDEAMRLVDYDDTREVIRRARQRLEAGI